MMAFIVDCTIGLVGSVVSTMTETSNSALSLSQRL
jgi:hypothetical protein